MRIASISSFGRFRNDGALVSMLLKLGVEDRKRVVLIVRDVRFYRGWGSILVRCATECAMVDPGDFHSTFYFTVTQGSCYSAVL